MARIKVSRQGLTRCPACSNHIEVAVVVAKTVCPFCQAELGQALAAAGEGGASPLQRLAGSGRSAIIAASMLGMPLVGCADGETSSADAADVVADTADMVANAAVYGMPADEIPTGPEDAGPSEAEDTEEISVAEAEENIPVDVYGMPADADADF